MKDLNFQEQLQKALQQLQNLRRYSVPIFLVFIALVYSFVVYRVQLLNASEPSPTDVATQSNTASVPHIDPAVLAQLQQLQDNSVSVQSLFNGTRSNPFQE